MDAKTVIETIGGAAGDSGLFDALFLAGSFGKGSADQWSDVDLVGLAPPDRHPAIAAWWRAWIESQEPLIYFKVLNRGGMLINAITAGWLRLDLNLPGDGKLGNRPQDGVKPLHDPADIHAGLVPSLPEHRPDREQIESMVLEFLRVMGLTPVGLGRQEYVTMVMGTGLLRDMLSQLMQEELPIPDRGGILHLSRLLPPEDMKILLGLPYPGPEPESLVAAQLAIARIFLPRARALLERIGGTWPAQFEAAVRAHLGVTLKRTEESLWPIA
ncbi:MAG: hypothetical protein KIT02_09990 [Devosia sp.]|uniref:hypothetical protein n=1 Tax=Devosia sp. TaxID=1871048 RepID=UPI0024C5AC45|nr:hypothetical protein [Devosia sp.]UYN98299.1 MAG: hypothetical protein KIT02_09990 [Devosia sp.]